MHKFGSIAASLVCAFLLGCQAKNDQGSGTSASTSASSVVFQASTGKSVPAELVGYNHTDNTIAAFYVNGAWGGNAFPHSGGGKFVCCVDLPDPWPDGYRVTITWEDHEGKTQRQEVSVPKYDPKTLSDFNVHFLRGGEIRVFAVRMGLGHRDYPLKGPEAELKPGVPIEIVN